MQPCNQLRQPSAPTFQWGDGTDPWCRRDIVETVLRMRERVGPDGVVFTSGGIGPTHDDITYEVRRGHEAAQLDGVTLPTRACL